MKTFNKNIFFMTKMKGVVLLIFYFVLIGTLSDVVRGYTVKARRLSNFPVINSQIPNTSIFNYNYNPSYVPLYGSKNELYNALMVRCQDKNGTGVGPSELSLTINQKDHPYEFEYTPIVNSSIKFEPSTPLETYGTEDPRIAYRPSNKMYYMMYSAVESKAIPKHGTIICRLSLATTTDPRDASKWERKGAIWPDQSDGWQWSKSGAIMIRDGYAGPHYLIWGDSEIQLATSPNLLNWTNLEGIYIHTRADHFDSVLVESGPPPMLLSDGNYLFIYNSARKYAHSGPNGLQYNAGWVIIDGNDPTRIIERSSEPLLSPTLPWEIGTAPYLGLTPQVVFIEGMQKGMSVDTFIVYYGAADSVVGVAEVAVQVN